MRSPASTSMSTAFALLILPSCQIQTAHAYEVYTAPGEIPCLSVKIEGKDTKLPLKRTDVKANIVGPTARVEVSQTYRNDNDDPIEAIYIFPLPENSAVTDMRIQIGDRTIVADIRERSEARRTYETAKRNGHTAALLEQERPNIFTQSVANIAPNSEIDAVIQYSQTLTYDSGQYEFVFPMVVGPRFNPGKKLASRLGLGWGEDTDKVPDASRITPPVLGKGTRSGHDISLTVQVRAGLPILSWEVPSHDVREIPASDEAFQLQLTEDDSIPNRDFVLKYRVDGDLPQAAMLLQEPREGEQQGYFLLIVQPPKLDIEREVGRREMVFVVDISGSMSGFPISMCKDAMVEALDRLRPVDVFNVVTFEGSTSRLFSSPRPANSTNIQSAKEHVYSLRGRGGTMMADGVRAALRDQVTPGYHRYVFFMTDGYIGNEDEIFFETRRFVEQLDSYQQKARVFAFGVGSSVNHHLIEGLSSAGNGISVFAGTREDPTLLVQKFYRHIDKAIFEELEIDWDSMGAADVVPSPLPDLFASRPLIIHGRYHGDPPESISLKGSLLGDPLTISAPVEFTTGEDLSSLWARQRVAQLERDAAYGHGSVDAREEIKALGLSYRLVTKYTSFVAVDRHSTVDGKLKTIVQPVESPEGVDPVMAGAAVYAAAPAVMSAPMPKMSRSRSYRSSGVRAARKSARVDDLFDSPSGGGSKTRLSKDDIMSGVKRNARTVMSCLKIARSSGELEPGRYQLILDWTIKPDGTVSSPRVKGPTSILNTSLPKCFERKMRKWKFPASSAGAPIRNFPFGPFTVK